MRVWKATWLMSDPFQSSVPLPAYQTPSATHSSQEAAGYTSNSQDWRPDQRIF